MTTTDVSAGPRIAVVTGGGSGIGRAAVLALAADGFHLVVTGRRPGPLDDTCAAVTALGGTAVPLTLDVTDEASVRSVFRRVVAGYGRIDLLVNNAGAGAPAAAVTDVTTSDWDRVVATNLTGTFLCTREAFAVMRDQEPQGGRIINNGSVSAHAPRPNSVAYTATKHAITGLTRSTSLDGRAHRIACGQIDVGNAATEMTQRMATGILQSDGEVRAEPTMSVEDVGRAIAYMASLPLEANILTMTVMATAMPYVGRG